VARPPESCQAKETAKKVPAGIQEIGGGSIAPGSYGIRALAVDPHDPRRLLAGTAKRGIFTFTEP
jgi:hypothetical protein